MAVSVEGQTFVWGRNDKNQLGIGLFQKNNAGKVRRIVFKAKSNSSNPTNSPTKVVELPSNDTNVETATPICGVEIRVEKS